MMWYRHTDDRGLQGGVHHMNLTRVHYMNPIGVHQMPFVIKNGLIEKVLIEKNPLNFLQKFYKDLFNKRTEKQLPVL
jgi:hypothetical protein